MYSNSLEKQELNWALELKLVRYYHYRLLWQHHRLPECICNSRGSKKKILSPSHFSYIVALLKIIMQRNPQLFMKSVHILSPLRKHNGD